MRNFLLSSELSFLNSEIMVFLKTFAKSVCFLFKYNGAIQQGIIRFHLVRIKANAAA